MVKLADVLGSQHAGLHRDDGLAYLLEWGRNPPPLRPSPRPAAMEVGPAHLGLAAKH